MLRTARLAVTTTSRVFGVRAARARSQAARWNVPFLEREGRGLGRLLPGFDALLVYEPSRVRLVDAVGDVVCHPGMAHWRILRMRQGSVDPLVSVGGLVPGARVLDATLGFGQDALVAAAAVGPSGLVVGLEASLPLYAFAHEGLPGLVSPAESAPIQVEWADAADWLASTALEFDLVMLDPMFTRARDAQPGFDLLRRHAVEEPLDEGLVKAALQVARAVVVKLGHVTALDEISLRPEAVRHTQSLTWARFGRG
jgi:16S rRNA (guanine1516-N2)-methyltransferase